MDEKPQPQSIEPAAKKSRGGCSGCFIACAGVFIFLLVVGSCLGPITPNLHKALQSVGVQNAHVLGMALYSYANNHEGLYPDGTSSTEVFQKLMDGGYVTDPSIFYIAMDGKTRAASNQKLKPENVCWDVTGGVWYGDDDRLPLVYMTGFRVTFAPGGGIKPLEPFPPYEHYSRDGGMALFFVNSTAMWISAQGPLYDGRQFSMEHLLPPDFNAHGKTYRQLTPDGVLR